MIKIKTKFDRRDFLKKTSAIAIGGSALASAPLMANSFSSAKNEYNFPPFPMQSSANVFGTREGYTPQMGFMVSMMDWMRMVMLNSVRNLSMEELDYIHDEDANSIGAMLMHLAATERYYQLNTFDGLKWGNFPKEDTKIWDTASGLGEKARKDIKGNELPYYLDQLKTVRENTLKEFAKRDDEWLLAVDNDFAWGPTNNYCKWFHVCEHESNHNGQIKFIRSRVSS